MGHALPGAHLCAKHQGNHSHYAEHNCRICTLERELSAALAEVKRLNEWADGMTDAALKERQTGEMYQRELRAEIERLRQQQDELARRVALRFMLDYWPWELNDEAVRADAVKVTIVRVRAEMEKEKGNG